MDSVTVLGSGPSLVRVDGAYMSSGSHLISIFIFSDRVPVNPVGRLRTHFVDKAGLKLRDVYLPLECWDERRVPPLPDPCHFCVSSRDEV